MTLEEWLQQEMDSWVNAGKPGGWSSGWINEGVWSYYFEWQPNIRIDSDEEITLRLRPLKEKG